MDERQCAVCGGPIKENDAGWREHSYAEDCVAHVRATLQAAIDVLNKEMVGAFCEIDRLRKIIADAPHEKYCRGGRDCDCFKSFVDQAAAAS